MPYAERIDEYLWMTTRLIFRISAIGAACCPPAPPKEARLCLVMSASAGSNSVDIQLRHGNVDSCRVGLKNVLVLASITRHVSGRSAHVEADDGDAIVGVVTCFCLAHNAASRARQQRLEAGKVFGRAHTAVRLHEFDSRVLFKARLESFQQSVDVLLHHRRQVRIEHGRLCAWHCLDHRDDLVGRGDELEAQLDSQLFQFFFMVLEIVAVNQTNSHGLEPVGSEPNELAFGSIKIYRLQDLKHLLGSALNEFFAIKQLSAIVHLRIFGIRRHCDSLVDFNDLFVQHARFDNFERKQVGSALVADAQKILEPLGGDKGTLGSFSFEKSVCCNCGSQTDAADD
ncbi:hypothetical protein OGATHE_005987 [Ogataea polymorpha]|uniref:Uncharacterized protein n=1 Tax=Ogataea polymorpha TaxID=460523 RepID=A0A9P8NUL8_9ASCO|nr:hypothetical protein OGATHE_005987 [Ogataea polymorpha]